MWVDHGQYILNKQEICLIKKSRVIKHTCMRWLSYAAQPFIADGQKQEELYNYTV